MVLWRPAPRKYSVNACRLTDLAPQGRSTVQTKTWLALCCNSGGLTDRVPTWDGFSVLAETLAIKRRASPGVPRNHPNARRTQPAINLFPTIYPPLFYIYITHNTWCLVIVTMLPVLTTGTGHLWESCAHRGDSLDARLSLSLSDYLETTT